MPAFAFFSCRERWKVPLSTHTSTLLSAIFPTRFGSFRHVFGGLRLVSPRVIVFFFRPTLALFFDGNRSVIWGPGPIGYGPHFFHSKPPPSPISNVLFFKAFPTFRMFDSRWKNHSVLIAVRVGPGLCIMIFFPPIPPLCCRVIMPEEFATDELLRPVSDSGMPAGDSWLSFEWSRHLFFPVPTFLEGTFPFFLTLPPKPMSRDFISVPCSVLYPVPSQLPHGLFFTPLFCS